MYIQRNKVRNANGKEYVSVMLCEKYRVKGDKNPKTRTLLKLSQLPEEVIMSIESTLKSKKEAVVKLGDIQVEEVVDFGYFFVINKLMEELKINSILEKSLPDSIVSLVKIMIVGILISTNSKLGILNWLRREDFVAKIFGVEGKKLTEKDFYNALTVLNLHKSEIEKKWFRQHNFQSNSIYLYDITSSYFEGVQNELAAFGYNRDGKKGKMQICIGLITDNEGFPLKIDIFKGNTADSETVENQVVALQKDFGINDIIFVGDRGMRIRYHIENKESTEEDEENNQTESIKFITGLTHAEINNLISEKTIDISLFDNELAEVFDENYRYILFLKKLCGKYVICTNVEKEKLPKEAVRAEYKKLQYVEHAFRDLKSDLISIPNAVII